MQQLRVLYIGGVGDETLTTFVPLQ